MLEWEALGRDQVERLGTLDVESPPKRAGVLSREAPTADLIPLGGGLVLPGFNLSLIPADSFS